MKIAIGMVMTVYLTCTVYYTVHCKLYTANCTMQTVHCKLYTINCTLYTLYIRYGKLAGTVVCSTNHLLGTVL